MGCDRMGIRRFREEFSSSVIEDGNVLRFQPRDRDEAIRGVRAAVRFGLEMGLEPGRAIQLDLSKFSEILEMDETSRLLHVGAGASLAKVEETLRARSMSLDLPYEGDFPLYRLLLARRPGGLSPDDDPVRQLVAGVEAIVPDGRALSIRPAPRRAVGPDFTLSMLKSGGELAFPLSFWLAYRAHAEHVRFAFRFGSKNAAEIALAQIRGQGVRPVFSAIHEEILELHLEKGALYGAMSAIVARIVSERGGEEFALPADSTPPVPEAAPPSPALGPFVTSMRRNRS